MPTAQATQVKSNINNNDNKIAKAAAKVAEERKTSITNTQSTGENQPQQQQQQQSGSGGNKTPQDQPEFVKQVLAIIEKKVRNLEKRRSKLDEYKDTQKKGTVLNEDQLSAVSKYDEVTRTLDLARELEKQFVGVANDAMKQQKKQAKKEQLEREELIKDRLKESQKIVTLLKQFSDETVRNDFLNERNGAIKISQEELSRIDEYFKLVNNVEIDLSKLDTNASESAECLFNLIEGKNKQVAWSNKSESTTYNELKKLFERLLGCSYWNKEQHVEEKIQEQQHQQHQEIQEQEQPEQQQQQEHQSNDQNMVQQMNNLVINDIAHHQQQNTQPQEEHQQHNGQQQVLQQQNTSDDYVLVNSNDFHENNTQQQQQNTNSPTSQQNTKTFFSTLNQGNERNNINEFLNRCENNDEGLNFLQDSELQSQQKLQQQESQQVNSQQQQPQQFNNFQEFNNQNDSNKDNRGNRSYQQRGPSKYQDNQRRSGGGPSGNYQRTNGGGPSGPRNYNGNYRPSGDRPSGDRPSGDRPSGDRPNRGGYRGGNYQNSGPRPNNGTGNGPRHFNNQSQQPQTQAV